jgi:MYXO-CTERM domain-containing protein
MTHAIADLDVCAPPPPSCGSTGWLEEYDVAIPGVQCGPKPHESWFVEPPAPTCGTFADGVAAATTQPRPEQSEPMDTTQPRPSFAADSSGCSLAPGPHGAAGALWAALVALAWGYRRRRTS